MSLPVALIALMASGAAQPATLGVDALTQPAGGAPTAWCVTFQKTSAGDPKPYVIKGNNHSHRRRLHPAYTRHKKGAGAS